VHTPDAYIQPKHIIVSHFKQALYGQIEKLTVAQIHAFIYLFFFTFRRMRKSIAENRIQPLIKKASVLKLCSIHYIAGARGGVVVKTLRYKPAVRGFDSRRCHWNFSVT
jgi:hypothetical protein